MMLSVGEPNGRTHVLVPPPPPSDRSHHDHRVHFYENSTVLVDGVASFIGASLGAGNGGLIVATPRHRDLINERLRERGLNVDLAAEQGRYLVLDAAVCLARIMKNNHPHARGFADVVGGAVHRVSTGNAKRAAVFGEMVAILWAEEKLGAAIALEQLWNDLARTQPFALYCGYPITSFIRSEDGEALGRICAEHTGVIPAESYTSLADEDERLRAVVLLQQKAQALETEIEERTRMARELSDRNDELSQAIAARDEFLSVAAHELKTPVAGIKAAAQLARRSHQRGRLTEERLARYVDSIAGAADRLATLTNDLFDVARIRSGHLVLEIEPIELNAWIRDAVAGYQDNLTDGHTLRARVPTERCVVRGDRQRLDQVLVNLLDNAVKYSPDGGCIEVAAEPEDGLATIRVRDAGIGLPTDALETIFEPFGRAPNAARQHLPGLGLGLHICRDIVERHGGKIWAESAGEGQGTTIVLTLPRSQAAP